MLKNKYEIILENFKGPFDLLLHLIEKTKLIFMIFPLPK